MPRISDSKYLVMAGWNDVPHLSERTKRELLESTPVHLREARSKGVPVLGSGRIFPIDEEIITCDPFPLPDLWPRIAGMDIGWDHPTAATWLAWDRDTDTIYVYDELAEREQTPKEIAPAIKRRADWIPVAWPHDALQHEKGSGIQIANQYRDEGVNMLHEMARFPETGVEGETAVARTSVEAGVLEMFRRMQKGTWKVFKTCTGWLGEFRLYHRKDGKIVKVYDDRLSSSRYAMMMLRYAACPPEPQEDFSKLRGADDWRL